MSTQKAVVSAPLEQKSRQALTFLIISLSVVGVIALCITVVVLAPATEQLDTAKFVFSAALPLLASWVGTILAYYFSKENFLAATQSVTQMASAVSGIEKLRSISVRETMRPLREIKFLKVATGEEGQTKLSDLLAHFAQVDRIVLVESEAKPVVKWLVYKSLINEYISDSARGVKPLPPGRASVADLTLEDLVNHAEKRELFKSSFSFVSEQATLAEVKAIMDALSQCRDVFVTATGKPTEPIVGWITDNRVIEHSRVE
jgi:hypothetical protein